MQYRGSLRDLDEHSKKIIDLESRLIQYVNAEANDYGHHVLISFMGGYFLGALTVILILVSR